MNSESSAISTRVAIVIRNAGQRSLNDSPRFSALRTDRGRVKTARPTALIPSDRGDTSRRRGASHRTSPASRCRRERRRRRRLAPRRPGVPRWERLPHRHRSKSLHPSLHRPSRRRLPRLPRPSPSPPSPPSAPSIAAESPPSAPASSTRVTDGSASTVSVPFTLCPSIASTYGYSPGSNLALISPNVSFFEASGPTVTWRSSTIVRRRCRVTAAPGSATARCFAQSQRDSTATRPGSP